MGRGQSDLITIIGGAYFQPIADLVDRWLRRPPPPAPNKIQSGFYENGYAASVVLLLVAMLESYVSRLRYLQDAKGNAVPTGMKKKNATDVITHVFPRLRHKKALEDVYVIRDLLIHNHLWEIDYQYGGSQPMVLKRATRSPASGDKKHASRVNLVTRRTKALGLSALPTRVNRTDVRKVFDTIWKTLLEFERTNPGGFSIANADVRFRGNTVLFSELRNMLKTVR